MRLCAATISAEISEPMARQLRDAKASRCWPSAPVRSFSPLTVEGKAYYSVRQRFQSPGDEAIYVFGQHQQAG